MTLPTILRCRENLAATGAYTDPHTHASNNSSTVTCIRCRGTRLPSRCLAMKGGTYATMPLPSNDKKDAHTDTHTDGRDS
jgi:hypothetical protein